MICSVKTLGINGIQANGVVAECYISNGLPGFDIVGLPDAAVKEARDRVRAAAKNSGLTFPTSRITVNLAPANVKYLLKYSNFVPYIIALSNSFVKENSPFFRGKSEQKYR